MLLRANPLISNELPPGKDPGEGIGSYYCVSWLDLVDELREGFRVAHEMGMKVPKLVQLQLSAEV